MGSLDYQKSKTSFTKELFLEIKIIDDTFLDDFEKNFKLIIDEIEIAGSKINFL